MLSSQYVGINKITCRNRERCLLEGYPPMTDRYTLDVCKTGEDTESTGGCTLKHSYMGRDKIYPGLVLYSENPSFCFSMSLVFCYSRNAQPENLIHSLLSFSHSSSQT